MGSQQSCPTCPTCSATPVDLGELSTRQQVETVGGHVIDIQNAVADIPTVADTVGGIANTVGGIANTVGGIADTVGGIADTVGGIANTVGGIANTTQAINTNVLDIKGAIADIPTDLSHLATLSQIQDAVRAIPGPAVVSNLATSTQVADVAQQLSALSGVSDPVENPVAMTKIIVDGAVCQKGIPLSDLDYPQPTCVPVEVDISDYHKTVEALPLVGTIPYSFPNSYQTLSTSTINPTTPEDFTAACWSKCNASGDCGGVQVTVNPLVTRPYSSQGSAREGLNDLPATVVYLDSQDATNACYLCSVGTSSLTIPPVVATVPGSETDGTLDADDWKYTVPTTNATQNKCVSTMSQFQYGASVSCQALGDVVPIPLATPGEVPPTYSSITAPLTDCDGTTRDCIQHADYNGNPGQPNGGCGSDKQCSGTDSCYKTYNFNGNGNYSARCNSTCTPVNSYYTVTCPGMV